MQAPTIDDIHAAARRLAGHLCPTPLLESPVLNNRFSGRVLFKPEVLQRTGSFKFRGAYNRISAIPEPDRPRGVVAFSSGNHAQGVAAAAQMFGVSAVIAMPADTPAVKLDSVKRMGAEVVPFDRFNDDRMLVVAPYVERGMTLVRPYDDPGIIAGQGTVGLEMLAEAKALGLRLDAVVVPCGGGGLTAGIALAVKETSPETEIWVAEPEYFDDTIRSLQAGRHIRNAPGHNSICDAILTHEPGELTFAINQPRLAGGLAVSDASVAAAMRDAAVHLKLVVEPGGCVGLAALASGRIRTEGRTIAVVLSGGNVDPAAYGCILAG